MQSVPQVSEIKIVPIGGVDRGLLEFLALTLPGTFGVRCVELAAGANLRAAYDPTRRQYHSSRLLTELRDLDDANGSKILGVTEIDLFIPIFTFVFGEAQVGGCAALMSTHRLRQQFYGLPEDRNLLFVRAEKEALHELGHTFGLAHCRSLDCVMRLSNSVEDVDVKGNDFCRLCDARVRAQSDSTLAGQSVRLAQLNRR